MADEANCSSVRPRNINPPPFPPLQPIWSPHLYSEKPDHFRLASKGTCAHDLASGFMQTCPYKYRVCKTLKKDVPLEQKKVAAHKTLHAQAVLERIAHPSSCSLGDKGFRV